MKKLIAFAILGAAVKYFLDSEAGREVKRQVQDWLGEVQDALTDRAVEVSDGLETAKAKMS